MARCPRCFKPEDPEHADPDAGAEYPAGGDVAADRPIARLIVDIHPIGIPGQARIRVIDGGGRLTREQSATALLAAAKLVLLPATDDEDEDEEGA